MPGFCFSAYKSKNNPILLFSNSGRPTPPAVNSPTEYRLLQIKLNNGGFIPIILCMRKLGPSFATLLTLAIFLILPSQRANAAIYCYVALNTSPQLDFFSNIFPGSSGLAASNYEAAFLQVTKERFPNLPWNNTSNGPFVLASHCVGDSSIDQSVAERTRAGQIGANKTAGHSVVEIAWPK